MLSACGDDDARDPSVEGDGSGGAASPPPTATGGGSGGMPSGGAPTAGDAAVQPLPAFPSGEVCALHVGASCDGAEDCAEGQRCCAQFQRITYSYTHIACSDSCEEPDQFELCHPGDTCPDPADVCRRSMIVPHDFINVCAMPATVSRDSKSVALEGEVVCGAETCVAGEQVCCLRANFDFATMELKPLSPYCASAGSACLCNDTPPITDDVEDGG